MSSNVSGFQRPPRMRADRGRRGWSTREEKVLLAGLKEIIAGGWKSDNGFRPGYLQVLEGIMLKNFPKTDLKALPHINSRIHTWKKNYGSRFSMISKTGIGLDHKTKMIEATDEAWEAHVKVDPNSRLMRHKSWPYYEAWCEIFGKDRANGTGAEDIGEASANPTVPQAPSSQPAYSQPEESAPPMFTTAFDGFNAETDTASPAGRPDGDRNVNKRPNGRKRRAVEVSDVLSDSVSKFCHEATQRLADIAERIGYEVDLAKARKGVFTFVDRIEGITLQEKLQATKLLGQNTEELEIFSGLPDDAKAEWARMKLAGTL